MSAATDIGWTEAIPNSARDVYPSSVKPAPCKPGPLAFFFKFNDNPLSVLPEALYREKMVQHGGRFGRVAWLVDPALIKDVLLDRAEFFPITNVQKRVFGPLGKKGVLTSEGTEWRWQRQTVAPLFRHTELLRYVPAMSTAAEVMLAAWAADNSGEYRSLDRDMTRLAFTVL